MPNMKRFGSSTVQFLLQAARAVRTACHLSKQPAASLTQEFNSSNAFTRTFCRAVKLRTSGKKSGRNIGDKRKVSPHRQHLQHVQQSSNSDQTMLNQEQAIILQIATTSSNDSTGTEFESDSISLEGGVGYESDEPIEDIWSSNSTIRIRSPGAQSDRKSSESGAELELSPAVQQQQQQAVVPELSGGVEFEANLQDDDDAASSRQQVADRVNLAIVADCVDSNKSEASDMPPDLLSELDDVDHEHASSRGDSDSCDAQSPDLNPPSSSAGEAITKNAVPVVDEAEAVPDHPHSGSNVDSLTAQPNRKAHQNWVSSRLQRVKRGLATGLRRLRRAVNVNHRGESEETAGEAHEVRVVQDGEVGGNEASSR